MQIAAIRSKSVALKLSAYFASVLNQFDQFVFVMLVVTIILRYTLIDADFVWARMFYCVTLAMYFLRFTHTFFALKNIGPKVIMIGRMVRSCDALLQLLE